jgi:hypothetical protein
MNVDGCCCLPRKDAAILPSGIATRRNRRTHARVHYGSRYNQPTRITQRHELREVELGVCTRDFGTPCVHEHAYIRFPALQPDPEQTPRLERILANLRDRVTEAEQQGWHGEIVSLRVSIAAAEHKLAAMRLLTQRHPTTHLGMPDFRSVTGRATTA